MQKYYLLRENGYRNIIYQGRTDQEILFIKITDTEILFIKREQIQKYYL